MTVTTIRVARVDPEALPALARRPTRGQGSAIAAVIAFAVTLVPAAFNGPALFFATGIPAAAVVGALAAPSMTDRAGTISATLVMATITIALADAFVVVGLAAGAIASTTGTIDLPAGIVGMGGLWLIGLVVVGVPMLILTTPCAIAWAWIVRRLPR